MGVAIILIFIVGYILIALEHPIKINKTATALITGVVCWTLFAISKPTDQLLQSHHFKQVQRILDVEAQPPIEANSHLNYIQFSLGENLSEIAQILFFLMGAMTIVELIDSHQGFKFITDLITTRQPRQLLWIVCWITFFLSAVLDNLTTTIVMVSLIRKLIPVRDMRLFFVGMIIIAANAGGAWSPIGDVTTTMLWIGGQITASEVIRSLLLPSIICLLVPLIYLSFTLKGTLGNSVAKDNVGGQRMIKSSKAMFFFGFGALAAVPVFKTLTHLPPYLGMMLGLGTLWVVSELINPRMDESQRKHFTTAHALSRIDMSSVLFFLGILLAVGVLQAMGTLTRLSEYLTESIGDNRIIITLIGILSSIVDNVPMVAGAMGMYSMETYPVDSFIWEYLAYCAGTGGSILVIGSAAGVAAMGMEKVDFIWYVKKVSLLAFLGYLAGAAFYVVTN